MKNEPPEIRQLLERHVASVSFEGNYIGKTEVFIELFNKLTSWAEPKGLISSKPVFLSSYENDRTTAPPDELKLDACLCVPDGTEVDNGIQQKLLPGGSYAVMHSELTDPAEYEAAWSEIFDWVNQSDYEVDPARPWYEVYLNNPEEHPEQHHIVELCVSVKSH